MSKVILNLAKIEKLTAQGVSDFVLDLKHVVGLVKSIYGNVEVTYKVGELPANKVYVSNSFEDLAEDLIAFNPDFFVATTEEKFEFLSPQYIVGVGTYYAVDNHIFEKQFLVNSKRIVGVAKVHGATEITLKAPEQKACYIDVSNIKYENINAVIKNALDKTKPVKYIIKEDFDEIASLVVYGAFDPELD